MRWVVYCKEIAQKLLIEFLNLKNILINDGECNWIRGVLSIIEKLRISIHSQGVESATYCKEACDAWRLMFSGNGSFSDYHLWHDDYNERVKRNIPLDSIKCNIAKILDSEGK